ncbi:membrane protein [Salmonella enterica subsp. enterica serovar Choleraesuis]|nr:membrane protein [Salmonella enterica subsp. enterica serovar Choleraesuis]
MAALATGVMLVRWKLLSALLMFLASTLNIQLRKAHFNALAVLASGMGIAASCWFAVGLLGFGAELPLIAEHVKTVVLEAFSYMPSEFPMMT